MIFIKSDVSFIIVFFFNTAHDFDINDVGTYPVFLTQKLRDEIISAGPTQINMDFPATNGRSFSDFFYFKQMSNGEKVRRDWLVYSKSSDSAHCFCCRLFADNKNINDSGFSSTKGFNSWKNLSNRIKSHELSTMHINCYTSWKTVTHQNPTTRTIQTELMKQFNEEKERLRQVFKRIIALILFFARQNIAFTGSTSNINDETGKNGNFQQLIRTVATFDEVLKSHLEKSKRVHYLSPKIQNELIAIIGEKVKKHILDCIKKSKYFSIILDGTTDITHREQMTIILRYVLDNEETQRFEVKESFIEFLPLHLKTGMAIKEAAKQELQSFGLDLDDLSGQSYDNGANMKGKNIGVQNLILEEYPKAFFVPCSNHSLNLVINDAAAASSASIGVFAQVQHIFTFLSGSSNRWEILKKHLTTASALAPKNLCPTRWSSRIAAIKPLRLNLINIIAALNEIKDCSNFQDEVRHEAGTIIDKIDYPFICAICMWYDILSQVNIASKALQAIDADMQAAILCLGSTKAFLEEYRSAGAGKVFTDAAEICEKNAIEIFFPNSRKRVAVGREINSEEQFENNFFTYILDVAINAVSERFDALEKHNAIFEFLYNFSNFEENRQNGNLLKSCKQLQNKLSNGEKSDIDGDELFTEMTVVANLVKNHNLVRVIDILNGIKSSGMQNLLPNAVIAYRIFLTTPVSVASGERSFSKLKIIKNYLRNSMSQERLNGLAIISIEHEVASSIQYDEVIDEFAAAKARKGSF